MRSLYCALFLLLLTACGEQGVSFDAEVDELGKHIVDAVKADAAVSDASYRYEHGLDRGQHLHITATVTDPARSDQVVDTAAKTFWQSPARVYHLTVTVQDASGATLSTRNIEDAASFDRPEMERSYGPRPTR